MKIQHNSECDGSKQPDKLYSCTSLIRDGPGTWIRPGSTGIFSSIPALKVYLILDTQPALVFSYPLQPYVLWQPSTMGKFLKGWIAYSFAETLLSFQDRTMVGIYFDYIRLSETRVMCKEIWLGVVFSMCKNLSVLQNLKILLKFLKNMRNLYH